MSLFINVLGVIVDIVMVAVTIKYAPSANNSTSPPPVIVKQYNKTSTVGIDVSTVAIGLIVAAAFYKQYSQSIIFVVSILCIICTVLFYLIAICKKEKNIIALIISSLTHILIFISIYLLQNPLYVVNSHFFSPLFTTIFAVIGIAFICIIFAKQILYYILRNCSLDMKKCLLYLSISIIAALSISGYLYHIIDQFQVPL